MTLIAPFYPRGEPLRTFVGLDLGGGQAVPDAITRLPFRHLLEEHELGTQITKLLQSQS